jgi:hypothetical protein
MIRNKFYKKTDGQLQGIIFIFARRETAKTSLGKMVSGKSYFEPIS